MRSSIVIICIVAVIVAIAMDATLVPNSGNINLPDAADGSSEHIYNELIASFIPGLDENFLTPLHNTIAPAVDENGVVKRDQ
jgi:hypothetical protein